MVQENCLNYDSIIILGSTATGKTGLSIDLAKALNSEIINADSMYIYKDLNIGTAKPTDDEMAGVKHHLISFIEPTSTFNVSEYRDYVIKIINDMKSRNLIPIIVGGTGFYIDSLIKNYSYGGVEKNLALRKSLQDELEKFGKEYIYNKLKALDINAYNRLHINDTKRVIRAIEIATLSANKNIDNLEEPVLKKPLLIGLNMPREILYDRINKRVDIMINNGLIDEIKALCSRGLNPIDHQSMKGIGYKELYDYLNGNSTLDDAIELIKQHTRNYAKRQVTWFKRNENINWFNILEDKDIVPKIIDMLNKKI